jgi:hypothetical protein
LNDCIAVALLDSVAVSKDSYSKCLVEMQLEEVLRITVTRKERFGKAELKAGDKEVKIFFEKFYTQLKAKKEAFIKRKQQEDKNSPKSGSNSHENSILPSTSSLPHKDEKTSQVIKKDTFRVIDDSEEFQEDDDETEIEAVSFVRVENEETKFLLQVDRNNRKIIQQIKMDCKDEFYSGFFPRKSVNDSQFSSHSYSTRSRPSNNNNNSNSNSNSNGNGNIIPLNNNSNPSQLVNQFYSHVDTKNQISNQNSKQSFDGNVIVRNTILPASFQVGNQQVINHPKPQGNFNGISSSISPQNYLLQNASALQLQQNNIHINNNSENNKRKIVELINSNVNLVNNNLIKNNLINSNNMINNNSNVINSNNNVIKSETFNQILPLKQEVIDLSNSGILNNDNSQEMKKRRGRPRKENNNQTNGHFILNENSNGSEGISSNASSPQNQFVMNSAFLLNENQ